MPNYNQRYAFVTSVPLDRSQGWGTATAVLGLLQALDRKGKRVSLVTPSTPQGPALWRRWWFNAHVPRTLKTLDVDTVVGIDCDGYRYAQSRNRAPCVMLLHGVKADEIPYSSGIDRRRLIGEAAWEKRAAQSADLVITPSLYSKERACELYSLTPDKVSVVYNGLDLDEWPEQPFHDNQRPVILSSASFISRKGLPTLLEAWKLVSDTVPAAQFRLAGDGPLRPELEQMVQRFWGTDAPVTFTGLLRTPQLRAEYAGCDVFCLPSRQEAFGMVYLEAMATGRPVVGTLCSAIPEVIDRGGIMVPPNQPEALARVLLNLLDSKPDRERWGKKARAQAQKFTWDLSAQQFGALLAAL